jgi:hypothetical protein
MVFQASRARDCDEEGHYPARIPVGDGAYGRAGKAFPTRQLLAKCRQQRA